MISSEKVTIVKSSNEVCPDYSHNAEWHLAMNDAPEVQGIKYGR